VVAAALVAVGLTPLRDRLQVAVDRLVYGDRRDPMRAVTRLGDRVAAAGETDLLPAVLATVTDAVRAPGASLAAADGAVLATCGRRPVGGTAAEVVPLRVGGRELGRLQVAARSPAEPYTHGDRRLLAALAPQVAVVVRALELAEALEAERDRVVAVTRQERQRLRRDLHDGLGPSLSGVSLGLQALQDARAADDQATADQLLARIREEVTTAVGEVRRILDDLRPAVLDSTRLPDALRRHAAAVSTGPLEVSVDAAIDLPVLPPAVETAAYRITQEALTNVVRHAGAHHAHITLDTSDAALTITVSDDGHGINSTTHPGVGLTSMRQRAQALQGTLRVDSSDHGTTVMAILPLQDGRS
jgi:signal transduction histidine kinase